MHKKYRYGTQERYEKVRADERRAAAKYAKTDKFRFARGRYRRRKRLQVFNFFGGKCVRCGFTDIRALHLDHINGRGSEKRIGNIMDKYKFINQFPDEAKRTYQILCANCNFIKREENHEYALHGRSRLK